MPINPQIPLAGQSPDLVGSYQKGLSARKSQQDLALQPKRNQLLDLQMQGQLSQNQSADAQAQMDQMKAQYMPMVTAATQIKHLGGATAENAQEIDRFLTQQLGGASTEVAQAIDQARDLLQSGDFQGFNAGLDAILQTGIDLGLTKAPTDSSFTLSAGQGEYNRDGTLIAERPKDTPQDNSQVLSEGQILVNKGDGTQIAVNPKDTSTVKLSVHMQKRLSDANDSAIEAASNAIEFEELAVQMEGANLRGGFFGATWPEKMKEFTGSQDAVTALRKRYFAIRSSQAIQNLPPGVASDKDIELALMGFPGDKANKEEMASFLRGMAKLERAADTYNTFKANHISTTGNERGMLSAWRESLKPKKGTGNIPPGFELMEDASGNKAYVHPDTGEVREVQ